MGDDDQQVLQDCSDVHAAASGQIDLVGKQGTT